MGDFLLAVLGSMVVGGASYVVQRNDGHSLSRRLRFFLLSVVGGLVGYSFYGLNLPGAGLFRKLSSNWGAFLMCLLFSLIPLGYVLGQQVWDRWYREQGSRGVSP
jgi:H+/Cl- antiporter ClcA